MNKYDVLAIEQREKGDTHHLDATETAFFKRQLEYVKSTTYDVKYRNLKAMDLIPVATTAPAGADYITWYSFGKAGTAKVIADYAHDFPRVDVYATENQSKIHSVGSSYGYSIKEVRRAAMAGVPLDSRRANTARRSIDELMDRLAWFGDPNFNIQGFIDYPGITQYTITAGAGGGTSWNGKTPDEIITDLTGLVDSVESLTKGREIVDTIIMPRENYNLIKNTRMGGASDKTVMTYFMDNNPQITMEAVDELQGQGAGATNRIMAYVKDSEHLTQEIPQPFEQMEPDKKGMTWEIPCHGEFGGVIVYYPQSVAFADGI